MQVADTNQLATSATLGGKEAISFEISNDPAFFHVLSTSLYNNPKLATARETICNSWDAHIEAGKHDVPILITITEDNFVSFRDYGNGIPTELMGAIYGTYGASTKKSNSKTTGGFGLGCKSPFSVVDSFQVTSWNQGTMSVYNVTKSSVETNGKPGIIPVVTGVPTEESGLEVKFQLNSHDTSDFIRYIKQVVFCGEIKAILRIPLMVNTPEGRKIEMTYNELPVLGMSFEPGSYDITDKWHYGHMGSASVYVRYGNVMYPAISSQSSEEAIGLLNNFLNIIGASRVVIQAEPDTLAVAPSRETLSNQKMTDDGLTTLCVNLVNKLEADIKKGIPKALAEIKEGIAKEDEPCIYDYPEYTHLITDRAVQGYMSSSLWVKQRRHYIKEWHNLAIKQFFEQDQFTGYTFNMNRAKAALRLSWKQRDSKPFIDFVQRYLVLPKVIDNARKGITWDATITGSYKCEMSAQKYLKRWRNLDILPALVTKNVVVTKRLANCENSFVYYPEFHTDKWKELCKTIPGYHQRKAANVVKVGNKKGEAEATVAEYTAKGYNVIDLTVVNDWDWPTRRRKEENDARNEARAARKAALLAAGMEGSTPNRLISINCVLGKRYTIVDGKSVDVPYIHSSNADPEKWKKNNHVDVENPVYYVMQNEVSWGDPHSNSDYEATVGSMYKWSELTDEVKATTVICRNKIEVNKAIKRGAVHIDDKRYLELMYIIKSKEFKKYATEQRKNVLESLSLDDDSYPKLFSLLGIKTILDKLTDNPEYDWAYKFLNNASRSAKEKLISLGCITTISDINPYINLIRTKNFKHLQALYDIKGIFSERKAGGILSNTSAETLCKWLESNPEDIPGYKVIIRNCLTKRKGTYTR